jgi:hypothetical protein
VIAHHWVFWCNDIRALGGFGALASALGVSEGEFRLADIVSMPVFVMQDV